MNKVIMIGNVVAKPGLRNAGEKSDGTPNMVANFRIGVTRPGQRDKSDFFNIVAWRGLAENCAKFLEKGNKVAICGKLQIRTYEDEAGVKRYVTEIVADDVEFLTPKAKSAAADANAEPSDVEPGDVEPGYDEEP